MLNTALTAAVYRKYAESKVRPTLIAGGAPLISNKGHSGGTPGNHTIKPRSKPAASTALREPRSKPAASTALRAVPAAMTLWRDSKAGKARVVKARRAVERSSGPPLPSATLACEPKSWVHTFCTNACWHQMVPSDSCGNVECTTCAPKLLSRRKKSAGKRFDGAPLLQLVLTYPEEVVARVDREALAALSPVAATVTDVWLRHVHHLPTGERNLLGIEDWPHPTGSGHCRKCGLVVKSGEQLCECGGRIRRARPWHPHHNILVRGQALWFGKSGGLNRKTLFPHVQRADLDLLRSLWADALRAVFGVDLPMVDVHYSYAKPNDEAQRRHIIKYVCRTWPGWHRVALGGRHRKAFGYFRLGWPLFRELLDLDKPAGLCSCGAPICAEMVDSADLRRLCEIRGLVNGRAPPG